MGYCDWASIDDLDQVYHDTEWGVPVHCDRHMFEHLCLECLQCGLSWKLMLKKREIFRQCFDGFDFDRVAGYGEDDIQRILAVPGMIRSRRKIGAVIHNAGCFQKMREEFGSFSDYLWAYSEGRTILYHRHELGEVPASNGLSDIISKDLKKRGFKYLGSITVYSHLQASGIVNDHSADCPCYQRIIDQYPTVRKRRTKER